MNTSEKFQPYPKKEKYIALEKLVIWFLCFLGMFVFIRLLNLFSLGFDTNRFQKEYDTNVQFEHEDDNCDLFTGKWILDLNGSSYKNDECKWTPDWRNCYKHGRKDTNFINWRWKPESSSCELPRFDPNMFLQIVQNKRMLLLGDSISKNHIESLLCLLSQASSPTELESDPEIFRTFYFNSHNFTIYFQRSTFLVSKQEIVINNTKTNKFNLHIDKVEKEWSQKLPKIEYLIISGGHWFFRTLYLHENKKLIGCVYCNDPNIKKLNPTFAIRNAFRTTLNFINECKNCEGLVTLIRTLAPAHFDNGTWDKGGRCDRTRPITEEEINFKGLDWKIRNIQVEEMERARKGGKTFEVLDVTKAMIMRPDGHPNSHWNNQWNKGVNDCLHWCSPGPIDMWSDLLLMVLKKHTVMSD